MRLKVLTFNTWGAKSFSQQRWPLIGTGLAKLSPDLMGLQEVFSDDQVITLQKITGMPEISFVERESGLVILSRFPIQASKIHRYQAVSPTESYLRYCQISQIQLPERIVILFVVTHLSWKPEDSAVREKQIRELLQLIDENNPARQICILAGDFNTTPDSSEIQLLYRAGFADTFASLHPDEPGFTWSHNNPYTASHPELPERRIDHIFIQVPRGTVVATESSEIVLSQPTAEGVFPSDHFGVLTTFQI